MCTQCILYGCGGQFFSSPSLQARKERMIKLGEEAKKKAPETETDRLKAATNAKVSILPHLGT